MGNTQAQDSFHPSNAAPGTYWCAKEGDMCTCTGEITFSPELFDGYVYTVPEAEQAYKDTQRIRENLSFVFSSILSIPCQTFLSYFSSTACQSLKMTWNNMKCGLWQNVPVRWSWLFVSHGFKIRACFLCLRWSLMESGNARTNLACNTRWTK